MKKKIQPQSKKRNPILNFGDKLNRFPKGVSPNPGGKKKIKQTMTAAYQDIGESQMTPEQLAAYAKAGHTSVMHRKAAYDYLHAFKGSPQQSKEINERTDGAVGQTIKAEVKSDVTETREVRLVIDDEKAKSVAEIALKLGLLGVKPHAGDNGRETAPGPVSSGNGSAGHHAEADRPSSAGSK